MLNRLKSAGETNQPYKLENGVIKNRVEGEEWTPWQKSNPAMKIGLAEFSGLPLVMHNVPVGIATFSGLPMIYTGWEFQAIGKATFSGLPLEKWFAYTPSFFIQNQDGIILKDLSFESLFAGDKSEVQKLTVINNLEHEMHMTLTPGASLNQMGSDLDTYLSQYSSVNGVDFSTDPLTLIIPAKGEMDFYTYWQAAGNSKIGWKQWLYDLDLEGVPSLEGWGYVSWLTVTGTGVAIEEPYVPYSTVKVEYVHGLMEYDFKDIRFALEDHTILKHLVISKTDGDHAYFLIELPEVPPNPEEILIYVYSGNTGVEDESDSSLYHLNEYFKTTEPTEVLLSKWENHALSYSIDNGLVFTASSEGYMKTKLLNIPESFNYQFDLFSGGGQPHDHKAVCLFDENDNYIIFAGYEDINIWTHPCFKTESEWINVREGWTVIGILLYHPQNGSSSRRDIFNIVKEGNSISVYCNGLHIADTIITSTIDSIGPYYKHIGSVWTSGKLYYLIEAGLAGIPNPIFGEVEPAWINIYPLPVKADVLYKSRDLPGLQHETRFGMRIGGKLFE